MNPVANLLVTSLTLHYSSLIFQGEFLHSVFSLLFFLNFDKCFVFFFREWVWPLRRFYSKKWSYRFITKNVILVPSYLFLPSVSLNLLQWFDSPVSVDWLIPPSIRNKPTVSANSLCAHWFTLLNILALASLLVDCFRSDIWYLLHPIMSRNHLGVGDTVFIEFNCLCWTHFHSVELLLRVHFLLRRNLNLLIRFLARKFIYF